MGGGCELIRVGERGMNVSYKEGDVYASDESVFVGLVIMALCWMDTKTDFWDECCE